MGGAEINTPKISLLCYIEEIGPDGSGGDVSFSSEFLKPPSVAGKSYVQNTLRMASVGDDAFRLPLFADFRH